MKYVCQYINRAILRKCGWRMYQGVEGSDFFGTSMFKNECHAESKKKVLRHEVTGCCGTDRPRVMAFAM